MATRIQQLAARIREAEAALEDEFEERRKQFGYRIRRGRVEFDADIRRAHRAARESLLSFLRRTRPLVVLTAPVIYALIVPFAFLDLFVTLYQAICFPVYGIAKVRRGDYIAIDRQALAYLNGLQKLNCVYCGYCNGLIAWVREVAARTEQHWCPIKHARRLADTHARYTAFTDFGDADEFRTRLEALRAELERERVQEERR